MGRRWGRMAGMSKTGSGPRWLLAAAGAGTAAAVGAVLARTRLGVADEWPVRYIRTNAVGVLIDPAVPALVLIGAAWVGLRHAGSAVRRRVALAVMLGAGFLLTVYLGMAGPIGVGEPVFRTLFSSGIGSYVDEARHIGPFPPGEEPEGGVAAPGPVAYLADFHRRVARHPLDTASFRVAVHPPGMTLLVYAVDRTWSASAERRDRGARFFTSLGWRGAKDLLETGAPVTSGKLDGLVLPLIGAAAVMLSALLIYVLTFELGGHRATAVGAAALWLTVPSVALHAPALDQITPLLALLIAWCWVRACATRRVAWAVCAGLAAWLGLFFTLAMAVVFVALGLAMVLWRLSEKGVGPLFWKRTKCPTEALHGRMKREKRGPTPFLVAAAAFAAVSVVAWLVFGYNFVLVLYQCARRNAEWNAGLGARSYGPWLAWNPVMFVLFFGAGATAVWVGGTVAALRRTPVRSPLPARERDRVRVASSPDKRRTTPHPGPLPGGERGKTWIPTVAVLATMAVLWLSGQNRGEVERLWSFLMALALVAGAVATAARRPLGAAEWAILLGLQIVLLFVLRYRVDVQNVLVNYAEHIEGLGG